MREQILKINIGDLEILKLSNDESQEVKITLTEFYDDAFGGDSDTIKFCISKQALIDVVNKIIQS